MKKTWPLLSILGLATALVMTARSQLPDSPPRNLPRESAAAPAARPAGIAWYATWESGLAEAKRTGKPILLVAAAPHCAGVSGIW